MFLLGRSVVDAGAAMIIVFGFALLSFLTEGK